MKFNFFRAKKEYNLLSHQHQQQKQKEIDNEDPATQCSVDFHLVKEPQQPQQPKAPRRHRVVQFQSLEYNLVHANTAWCKEDCADRWYNACEIASFKRDRRQQVAFLRAQEKMSDAPVTWARTLLRTYRMGCDASTYTTPHQPLRMHCDTASTTTTTTTLGLEKCAVANIVFDTHQRRKQLRAVVFLYNNNQSGDNAAAAEESLRRACQATSLPSRLYAQEIAAATAASL